MSSEDAPYLDFIAAENKDTSHRVTFEDRALTFGRVSNQRKWDMLTSSLILLKEPCLHHQQIATCSPGLQVEFTGI